jgi:hypothetical protein
MDDGLKRSQSGSSSLSALYSVSGGEGGGIWVEGGGSKVGRGGRCRAGAGGGATIGWLGGLGRWRGGRARHPSFIGEPVRFLILVRNVVWSNCSTPTGVLTTARPLLVIGTAGQQQRAC